MRASRCGAGVERKMLTTAEGSVVDTMAPISRQAISGSPAKGSSARPIITVATPTATTASTRIGTQSSSIRRRSMVSETWKISVGRKIRRKTSEEIGSRRIARATGFSASVRSVNQKKLAAAPMAMPVAAKMTVTGSRSRSASGPLSPMKMKSAARTPRSTTRSIVKR